MKDRSPHLRHLIVVVVWLVTAASGFAQPSSRHAVVSASVIDAVLLRAPVPGQSNPSIPTTGIGGSAVGVTLGIDIALSRRVGIDAELSTSRSATDHQEATKYLHKVRHRDTMLSGLVRFHLRPQSGIRVDAVAGASLVFSDGRIASSTLVLIPWHYDPFGDYERWPYGRRRYAVSAGVDVPIGGGRIAVVPTIRLHFIFRDEETKNQIGLGRWAIRPGIGLRVRF